MGPAKRRIAQVSLLRDTDAPTLDNHDLPLLPHQHLYTQEAMQIMKTIDIYYMAVNNHLSPEDNPTTPEELDLLVQAIDDHLWIMHPEIYALCENHDERTLVITMALLLVLQRRVCKS